MLCVAVLALFILFLFIFGSIAILSSHLLIYSSFYFILFYLFALTAELFSINFQNAVSLYSSTEKKSLQFSQK